MLDLVVIALFQFQSPPPGGAESRGPPPFRQEMVNQSSDVMGSGPPNPHFQNNRCNGQRPTGSRIGRTRCVREAAPAATTEAPPEQTNPATTEETTQPPPN